MQELNIYYWENTLPWIPPPEYTPKTLRDANQPLDYPISWLPMSACLIDYLATAPEQSLNTNLSLYPTITSLAPLYLT